MSNIKKSNRIATIVVMFFAVGTNFLAGVLSAFRNNWHMAYVYGLGCILCTFFLCTVLLALKMNSLLSNKQ